MSLIDYNLQSGISSDRHTGDGDERYSMKEGLNNIANAFGSFLSTKTKANQQLLKAQATANENAFADDMYKLYKKSTTTEMTDTQRMDEQQKIWDKYASVAPDTKYKIGEYYGFKAPTNMAWSLAEKQRGAIVTKADEETKRDYDMGVYVLGSDAVNMSPEEVIEVGRQTMLDRTMYADTVDYMVQQDPSKANLKNSTAYLASGLLKYTIEDIRKDIEAGTKIDELYVSKGKNNLIAKLQADGIPAREAMETANYIYYDLDSIAKLNTLTDKEKLEIIKRDNETNEAIFKKNFFDITHVPYDSFANLSRNLDGIDPDKRDIILSLGNFVFKAGELTWEQAYSLDDAYKGHAAMMGSTTSSGQQKTNTGTILAHANVVNNAKGMSQADATGKQNEFLNSSFVNNMQVLKELVKVAPVMNEVLGRMTRAEQQEYIRSNKANLEMTAVLAVGKMAQDVESPVVFNRETGQFELYGEGRKRTSDIRIVQAVNDALKDIKYVQDTVEGRFGNYEDIVKILMQEEIQQALHFKNDPLDPLTLWNHLTNSIKTLISSAWGGTDAEFLWQTERQGVRTSNIRRITGVTSPITDTLTSPNVDPFETAFQAPDWFVNTADWVDKTSKKIADSVIMTKDTRQRIKNEEGWRTNPTKNGTIGWGFDLESLKSFSEDTKKELEEIAPGITTGRIKYLYQDKGEKILDILLKIAEEDAKAFAGNTWDNLNEARKQALIDMAYNHGRDRLMKYVNVKEALDAGDYKTASKEILNSKYGKETHKARARRNATLMERGEF